MPLKAGSQAQPKKGEGGNRSFYFVRNGVNILFPSAKDGTTGIILPAHDASLSLVDESYKTSYVPYRDMTGGVLDQDTRTPAFTGWYFPFEGHRFVGREGIDYISRRTLYDQGLLKKGEPMDPRTDCFFWCKDNLDEQKFKSLTTRRKKEVKGKMINLSPVFQTSRSFAVMNWFGTDPKDKNKKKVMLLGLTGSGLTLLKEDLSERTPAHGKRRDLNENTEFREFLYGDITDPEHPLVLTTCMRSIQGRGESFQTNALRIGGDPDVHDLEGVREGPPVPEELLALRYSLTDDENVLWIPEYQEILDWMLQDGDFPVDIVKRACGEKGDVGDTSSLGTVRDREEIQQGGDEEEEDFNYDFGDSSDEEDTEVTDEGETEDVPGQTDAKERKFWLYDEDQDDSFLLSETELKAKTKDNPDWQCSTEDNPDDFDAVKHRFPEWYEKPKPTAKPKPAPKPTPKPVEKPKPSAKKTVEKEAQAEVDEESTAEDAKPTADSLSPDEKKRVAELTKLLDTDKISEEELEELSVLMQKSGN